jgi:hypothetical protein
MGGTYQPNHGFAVGTRTGLVEVRALPTLLVSVDDRCPVCGSDDIQQWADDGESPNADWWECSCGASGGVAGSRIAFPVGAS